jgi:hypothetical protein
MHRIFHKSDEDPSPEALGRKRDEREFECDRFEQSNYVRNQFYLILKDVRVGGSSRERKTFGEKEQIMLERAHCSLLRLSPPIKYWDPL